MRPRLRRLAAAWLALAGLLLASLASATAPAGLTAAAGPLPSIPPILPSSPPSGGPAAAPCTFAPLGPNEVRPVYTEPSEGASSPGRRSVFAGLDGRQPCHLFRAYAAKLDRSDNTGSSFRTTFTPSPGASLGPPASASTGELWVYDQAGSGIFVSPDLGQSWSERDNGIAGVGTGAITIVTVAVAPGDGNFAYAVTAAAGQTSVYRTSDAGASWAALAVPASGVTALAVDPGNPNDVFAAATGSPQGVLQSTDGGSTWPTALGDPPPGAPGALLATTSGNTYLFARTGQPGSERWWRLGGGAWSPLPGAGRGGSTALAFDPLRPGQMVYAEATVAGIHVRSSRDAFASAAGNLTFGPGDTSDLQLVPDRGGDFFLQATRGGDDNMYAFRLSALPAPGSHPAPPGSGALSCGLGAKPLPVPDYPPTRGTQAEWDYTTGSLAFDGRYLDYTYAHADPTSPTSSSPAANQPHGIDIPGVIFRLDPRTCQQVKEIDVNPADTGGPQRFYGVVYDPRYVFGATPGALLVKGQAGALKTLGRDVAPIWAVNIATGRAQLVAEADCSETSEPSCGGDSGAVQATVFTYDYFTDRIWVNVPVGDGYPRPQLAPLPPSPRLLSGSRSCLSTFLEDAPDQVHEVSTWTVGSASTVYVQLEDDQTVLRVDSGTCQVLGQISHPHYLESDDEDDQMVCDPVSFAGGSWLWIRDEAGNAVDRYPIPDGVCPFPDRIALDQPVTATVGQPVTVCATLVAASGDEEPIGGENVNFSLASKPVGAATTDGNGRACLSLTAPGSPGALRLLANFAGSRAYLPVSAAGTMTVMGAPPQAPVGPPGGALQVRPAAPPPAAPVPVPAPQPQVQGQAQLQAQLQAQPGAQVQPGVAAQEQEQAEFQVARLDGGKEERQLKAARLVRRDDTTPALAVEAGGLLMFGAALYWADRRRRTQYQLATSNRQTGVQERHEGGRPWQ